MNGTITIHLYRLPIKERLKFIMGVIKNDFKIDFENDIFFKKLRKTMTGGLSTSQSKDKIAKRTEGK